MQRRCWSSPKVQDCPPAAWIGTAPIAGRPAYPPYLDLLDDVVGRHGHAAGLAASLAPRWDDLVAHRLDDGKALIALLRDSPDIGELAVREHYLHGLAARFLLLHCPDGVWLFRDVHRFDLDSTDFLVRFLREAALQSAAVVVEAAPRARLDPRLPPLLAGWPVSSMAVAEPAIADDDEAALLALCPQGLPVEHFHRLTGREARLVPLGVVGGSPRLWLSEGRRRAILAAMPSGRRRALERRLAEAWGTAGWNYLRRRPHVMAGSRGALARDLPPLVVGLRETSLALLRDTLDAAVVSLGDAPAHAVSRSACAEAAARLIDTGRRGPAMRRRLRLLRLAVDTETDASRRIELLYEIANTHAYQRTPAALRQARRWYGRAYGELAALPEGTDKVRRQIRLDNGLALVEYHCRDDAAALRLEERALALAEAASDRDPSIIAWARPLLAINTAKLLMRRLRRPDEARTMLAGIQATAGPVIRFRATLDIGQMDFEGGRYGDVVEGLGPLVEAPVREENERDEFAARLLFFLAAMVSGQRDRASRQVARLSYLQGILDTRRPLDFARMAGA